MIRSIQNFPLVTVIIPTFNYATYLPKAIDSVLAQTYRNVEIIVIDDGSTDNTKEVAEQNRMVKYFFQENKGLSSARNAGIDKSNGKYLVFLDADDWLESGALEQNFLALKGKPRIAFVSGNYYFLRAENNARETILADVTTNHYARLLENNYIGMHAAVMFQRWVFQHIRYDETLRACEDYDLCLKIARIYPVIHHQKMIATYYFHSSGLSHDYKTMMRSVKEVIERQAPYIRTAAEEAAYLKGLHQWKDYYELMKASI